MFSLLSDTPLSVKSLCRKLGQTFHSTSGRPAVFSEHDKENIASKVRGAYTDDHDNLSSKDVESLIKEIAIQNHLEKGGSGNDSNVVMPDKKTIKKLAQDIGANTHRKGTNTIDILQSTFLTLHLYYSSAQT